MLCASWEREDITKSIVSNKTRVPCEFVTEIRLFYGIVLWLFYDCLMIVLWPPPQRRGNRDVQGVNHKVRFCRALETCPRRSVPTIIRSSCICTFYIYASIHR